MRPSLPLALLMGMRRRVAAHTYRSHPWVMVWTMAVAQVISWGTLFYAFSLFVVPMQESLGWSRPLLNGALSLGLLSTGVMAFLLGRTHYGAINGALTVPTTVAKALAPGAAALWSATGDPSLMLWMILGSALVGTLGFAMALSGASR